MCSYVCVSFQNCVTSKSRDSALPTLQVVLLREVLTPATSMQWIFLLVLFHEELISLYFKLKEAFGSV